MSDMFNKYRTKNGAVRLGDYLLVKKIGQGSFGDVYLAKCAHSFRPFAIKVEKVSNIYMNTLQNERRLYSSLNNEVGFPEMYAFGEEKEFRWLCLELLGASILDIMLRCHNRITLKSVLMLADQILVRIESVHRIGYVHRDIKPSNMMMGLCGRSALRLYLADFGLATPYVDFSTGAHMELMHAPLTGTMTYCSINGMRRCTQSRRDDLESIGYCLIFMVKGELPWQDKDNGTDDEGALEILAMKQNMPLTELCKNLPDVFVKYLEYTRNLGFKEEPDYVMLRRLFREEFRDAGFQYDFHYDWAKGSILERRYRSRATIRRHLGTRKC